MSLPYTKDHTGHPANCGINVTRSNVHIAPQTDYVRDLEIRGRRVPSVILANKNVVTFCKRYIPLSSGVCGSIVVPDTVYSELRFHKYSISLVSLAVELELKDSSTAWLEYLTNPGPALHMILIAGLFTISWDGVTVL